MNPKRRRCRRTPKLVEKTKSRHSFCHAEATGWRRDLFREENSHGGLNTLARGVRKLQTASGQVSWLLHRRFRSDDLHSGATARASHPLPYSSLSTRGTQTHLKELRTMKAHVTTRAGSSQKC